MASRKIFSLFGSIAIEGIAKGKKELTQFDKEVRATTRTLNKMAKSTQKVGKALTKNLTAPLLAAGVAAIKFGADFDQAMTNSLAIMGEVSTTMRNDLEMTAREVAKTTKFSATQAAEAYFFLASAGLSAAQSMEALPKVAAFAQAGNFDLAQATDLLTDAQSALGLSSEDNVEHMANMARVSDVLVKANTVANASVEEFSQSLTNKAGAALRLLNKDVEEGAAVLAVYADQGVKGQEAGTQLNIVLRDLQNAAIANKQGFQDAGIAVFDANGNMNNMADIVSDLEGRFLNMSDEQRRSELTTLGFTSKSVAATSALLGTSEAIREYETTLRGAAGITDEVAKKQLQTFWAQLGLVKDRLIDVGLGLFKVLSPILMNVLIPALNAVIKTISNLVNWFNNLNPIMKDLVTAVVAIAVAIGPMLVLYGKFLPLIIKLIPLYKALTAGQLTLNLAMLANPVGLWIAGIAALIAIGYVLIRNWDTVKTAFFNTWDTIKYHFLNIASSIGILYGEMILGIVNGINSVGKYIPGLNKGLEKLQTRLQSGIDLLKAEKEARKALLAEQVAQKKLTEEETRITEQAAEAAKKAAKEKAVSDAKAKKDEEEKLAAAKKSAEAKKILTLQEIETNRQLKEKAVADAKETLKKKKEFQDQWENKLFQSAATKLQILNNEKSEALNIADELGADTTNIEAYYAAQRVKINADANKKQKADDKLLADARKNKMSAYKDQTLSIIDQINQVWAASLDLRMNNIDVESEREKLAIENSLMSTEEKAIAIETIDKESDAKKLELQKENAAREKAFAIFSIILNTAMAITKALSLGPPAGLIFAVLVGALGVAQIAIAAAQPMPFAEGGYVKSRPGGVVGQIGEGSQDEVVLPMKTGARELANNIMGKLGKGAGGATNMAQGVMGGAREIHLHIGTLIADEFGVKTFAKKINRYIIAEEQRTGA